MKLPETKYLIAAAVVVFVVLLYFYWKYKKSEKVSDKKTSRAKNKKARKPTRRQSRSAGKTRNTEEQNDLDDQNDQNDQNDPADEDQDAAQELYNLVHDRMASGMQSDEFSEAVGDDYDNLTYIEIKQLYNDAKNKGQDPAQSITIDDYAAVLSKRDSNDY
jgi:hypothetical protein